MPRSRVNPKTLLLLASTLCSLLAAKRANADEHAAQAEWGLAPRFVQVRDDTLRPVRWMGGQVALVGGTQVDAGPGRHLADLELAGGLLANRFGHRGVPLDWGIHYAYLHSLGRRKPLEVLVGGAYRWETFAAYYADWDDSFMYWLTTHTLSPAVAFRTVPSPGHELFVLAEIPLVGVMSRPTAYRDYKVDPLTYPTKWIGHTHQNLRGAGPLNLSAPWFIARYSTMWSPRWGMLYSLGLAYRHTPRPRPFSLLTQTVAVEVRRVF